MNGNLGSKKWEFWSNFEISGGEKMVNFVRFWVKNGQKWLKMVNFWGRDEKMVDFCSFRKSAWGETSKLANFGFPGQGVGREKGSNLRNQMEMARGNLGYFGSFFGVFLGQKWSIFSQFLVNFGAIFMQNRVKIVKKVKNRLFFVLSESQEFEN